MVYTKSINYLPLCSFFLSKILRGSIELDLSELQGLDKGISFFKTLILLYFLRALQKPDVSEIQPGGNRIHGP